MSNPETRGGPAVKRGRRTRLRDRRGEATQNAELTPDDTIEVKSAGRVRPEDLRPLVAFAEEYPEAVPILLYRGTERLRIGKVWCLPVETFLRELKPDRPLIASGASVGGHRGKPSSQIGTAPRNRRG